MEYEVLEIASELKSEIEDRYMGENVRTIYIGGGTPSALSLKEIEYLLTLTKLFNSSFFASILYLSLYKFLNSSVCI